MPAIAAASSEGASASLESAGMRADVISATEALVRVDTAPGCSTGGLVDALVGELRALGAATHVQVGEHDGVPQANLVARLGGDGPAGLVLAGHLDTVPWRDEMRATTSPERDGRRLYGRGTCDMKGPIAAQLEAAARTADRLGRPLVLAYTYAEEIGCHGAMRLVDGRVDLGDLTGACCVVGEPTGLAPIVAHKGYGVATIELAGRPAHSSDPWAGADTSVAVGELLVGLHALRERLRAIPDDGPFTPPCTTLNTGLVQSGSARNVVPDRASITLEFRELPGFDHEGLVAEVDAILARALAAAPGVSGRVRWPTPHPPFDQSTTDPFVALVEQATGRAPGVVPFYTEAELYRAGLSVPTVVCGPGAIEQAHRVDESIAFDELEEGVELYAALIEARCG